MSVLRTNGPLVTNVKVDLGTIEAQISYFIEYLCISPQSLSCGDIFVHQVTSRSRSRSHIIQTIHLLTLNNLVRSKSRSKMQENGLNWHFLTSILLFFPEFGAKLLKYLF